jgi:hypothetical protein
MEKFENLKQLVLKNGTDKMKEMIFFAEKYISGFKRVFSGRPVSKAALEVDLPLFARELEEEEAYKKMGDMETKILLLNIFFIARHTWELVDDAGQTKTGDDLHKAYPILFEGDTMLDVNSVYENIKSF